MDLVDEMWVYVETVMGAETGPRTEMTVGTTDVEVKDNDLGGIIVLDWVPCDGALDTAFDTL